MITDKQLQGMLNECIFMFIEQHWHKGPKYKKITYRLRLFALKDALKKKEIGQIKLLPVSFSTMAFF